MVKSMSLSKLEFAGVAVRKQECPALIFSASNSLKSWVWTLLRAREDSNSWDRDTISQSSCPRKYLWTDNFLGKQLLEILGLNIAMKP